jgi:hypothetical protein
VENSFRAAGFDVERIGGEDRYETAQLIGEAVGAANVAEHDDLATAIVATGLDFADALAGGPLAAAGDGTGVHPVLLVDSGVPQATEDAIDDLGIEQVIILGGSSAVSPAVQARLEELTGNDAVRLQGTNRYETAVAIADAAIDDFDFGPEEVLLANGVVFADALAGAPLGGLRGAPILLTPATTLAPATETFLTDNSRWVETITVLGGPAAVATSVANAAKAAAESPSAGANESLRVSPLANAHQANGSTREYKVSGLGSTPVDIALVHCASVSTTTGGDTVFANVNSNVIADGTAQAGSAPDRASVPTARISSVNGSARATSGPTAPTNDDYVNNAAPSDGTVTFVVEGPTGSPLSPNNATVCVVPVVFVDANVDNALNGTTANPTRPTEDFGTGGAVTFSPSAAGEGQFGSHEVDSVEKASDRFTACAVTQLGITDPNDCKTFVYDAGDNFQIDSQPVSFAVWEAALSPGDFVKGNYSPSGTSTFNLTDEDQPDEGPSIASAQGSSADTVANADDVHQLVFDTRIATPASDITYQVTDGDGTVATIRCGSSGLMSANALCTLDSAARTLRARLTATPSTSSSGTSAGLAYPLTVTATNVTDGAGNSAVLSSGDRVIERTSLLGDVTGPRIIGATLVNDTDPVNFNSVGDVMHLTFNEAVSFPSADKQLSEPQLEAILGVDVTYGVGTTVTVGQVNPTTLSLTVSGGDFFPLGGVQIGQELPGTGNTNVVDGSRNPQAVNPNPTSLQPA